jgi:iron(III) transport system substrate-binding protein
MMAQIKSSLFIVGVFVFLLSSFTLAPAITLPELTARVEKLSRTEREALFIKGAKEEKEVMFYATTPVNQVAVLKKAFSARYPFVDLKHYYSPRQGILNKTVSEYRGNANITDVVMTDVSYGTILIKEGVSHPYTTPDVQRYVRGSYDPKGHWYTMYMLTTALVYNRNLVKPGEAPKTYQDLLDPKWKGKMMFDPEAAFIMAAMEEVWGKEKARDYLAKLAKQDLIFRRGTTLTSQLIAAGEHPIAIAINAETTAEMRDKGAPLGFSVLPPRIIKPNGFFVAKNAPHPHAALLFTDWSLSEEGQKVLAVDLGKGVAMKGIPAKYKEFQGEPDYVVGPEFGNRLKQHMTDFQKIFGM